MPGAIVELRRFNDARKHQRVALAVRSDLPIEEQVSAAGATWLDRQLVAFQPATLSESGFGAEARHSLQARGDHLVGEGLSSPIHLRSTFSCSSRSRAAGATDTPRSATSLKLELAAELPSLHLTPPAP